MRQNGEDVGLRAVGIIYERLYVDDEWSISNDRGFIWWPHEYPQYVSVTVPRMSRGHLVAKVSAVTPVLEGVQACEGTYQHLSMLNAEDGDVSALVLTPDGVVSYVVSATVHEAILMNIERCFPGFAA